MLFGDLSFHCTNGVFCCAYLGYAGWAVSRVNGCKEPVLWSLPDTFAMSDDRPRAHDDVGGEWMELETSGYGHSSGVCDEASRINSELTSTFSPNIAGE